MDTITEAPPKLSAVERYSAILPPCKKCGAKPVSNLDEGEATIALVFHEALPAGMKERIFSMSFVCNPCFEADILRPKPGRSWEIPLPDGLREEAIKQALNDEVCPDQAIIRLQYRLPLDRCGSRSICPECRHYERIDI